MSRPFEFKDAVKKQARVRQQGRCAQCGEDLSDLYEEAHHVTPNQCGERGRADHRWLAEADNCVVLCKDCHHRVHEDGRTVQGALAPASYFQYSHGGDQHLHELWVAPHMHREEAVWWDRH